MKICVIGAGLSGLVTIKELKEAGQDVVCYEQTAQTGGVFSPALCIIQLSMIVS